jgi:hypothetical protein
MRTEPHSHEPQPPGQGKPITIIVNGRPKTVAQKELSFREVVALAFESPVFSDTIIYTVTYKRGHGEKPEGTMVDGDEVRVKEDMVFNVARTDKS